MRKVSFVVVAALLVAAAAPAMAQEPPPPPPGGMRQGGLSRSNPMAMLMQGITLSAEQQAKVDSVSKKYTDMMMALRQDQSLDRETRMAKNREMRTKQYDEVKAVLNDEQKKVFEKNLADMQARMQQGRPPTA